MRQVWPAAGELGPSEGSGGGGSDKKAGPDCFLKCQAHQPGSES